MSEGVMKHKKSLFYTVVTKASSYCVFLIGEKTETLLLKPIWFGTNQWDIIERNWMKF